MIPTEIANCVCWLKAGVGVYSDAGTTRAAHGDLVHQWSDQSGAGNHAIQATSGDRPKWNAIDGYLEFCLATGENQEPLLTLGSLAIGTQAHSIFVICEPLTLRGKAPSANESGFRTFVHALSGTYQWGYCHSTDYGNATLRVPAVNNGSWRNGSSLVPTSPCLLGTIGSASSCRFLVNDSTDTIAALASATLTGLGLFGQAGESRSFWGGVKEVIIYDRAVTDQELADLRTYAAARGAIYASRARNVLLYIGDSITTGQVAVMNRTYARFARRSLPPTLEYTIAQGSATLAGMTTDQAAFYDTTITAGVNAGKRVVVSIFAGSADIGGGASAATAFSRTTTLSDNLKAAGAHKTSACLMLPRASNFEAARVAFNDLLDGNAGGHMDAICRWGDDANMGQADQHLDDTYYADDLHPNATGFSVGAGHFVTALAPLLLDRGRLR